MPSWDYTDFSEFYDCSGVGNLLGENGDILIEQLAVAEIADGKFGTARGPFTTSSRFQRSGTGIWDTRAVSGFTKGSLIAWFRTTSNTAIQTVARQGNTAVSNQWNLRGVWPGVGDTPDDDSAVLLVYDWALDNGTYQVGGGVRASQGAFPLNVWCMIGWSVDIGLGIARLFLGVPGEGTYFNERSMAGWNAFQSPNASTIVVGANNTTEPLLGGVDHITWTNGRAYELQDFENHWNDGAGLERSAFLRRAEEYVNPLLMAARRRGRRD